jgi:hypothetical protein
LSSWHFDAYQPPINLIKQYLHGIHRDWQISFNF